MISIEAGRDQSLSTQAKASRWGCSWIPPGKLLEQPLDQAPPPHQLATESRGWGGGWEAGREPLCHVDPGCPPASRPAPAIWDLWGRGAARRIPFQFPVSGMAKNQLVLQMLAAAVKRLVLGGRKSSPPANPNFPPCRLLGWVLVGPGQVCVAGGLPPLPTLSFLTAATSSCSKRLPGPGGGEPPPPHRLGLPPLPQDLTQQPRGQEGGEGSAWYGGSLPSSSPDHETFSISSVWQPRGSLRGNEHQLRLTSCPARGPGMLEECNLPWLRMGCNTDVW